MGNFGRIAIFSDVHGNLEALQTVLAKIAEANVDRVICLGDVVGYGADPNDCLQGVREVADFVLAGNHDWAVVGLEDLEYFNPVAREAVEWTARVISEDNAAALRAYKPARREGGCCYAHATPLNPAEWNYLFDPDEGSYALAYTDFEMCFVGHSHHAFVCSASRKIALLREGTVQLTADDRYLVNVGSVGQPRDGDARAAFAVWDRENGNLELHRVSYDVATAQAKILAAGLPPILAERIEVGM